MFSLIRKIIKFLFSLNKIRPTLPELPLDPEDDQLDEEKLQQPFKDSYLEKGIYYI